MFDNYCPKSGHSSHMQDGNMPQGSHALSPSPGNEENDCPKGGQAICIFFHWLTQLLPKGDAQVICGFTPRIRTGAFLWISIQALISCKPRRCQKCWCFSKLMFRLLHCQGRRNLNFDGNSEWQETPGLWSQVYPEGYYFKWNPTASWIDRSQVFFLSQPEARKGAIFGQPKKDINFLSITLELLSSTSSSLL